MEMEESLRPKAGGNTRSKRRRFTLLFLAIGLALALAETGWAKANEKPRKKGKSSKVILVEKKVVEKGQNHVLDLPGGGKLELLWVKPGEYSMGSPKEEPGRGSDEAPHLVKLTAGYWLGKYEVTQGQWEAVMESNPSNFAEAGNNAPVEKVSWKSAIEFCQKLTEREGTAGRLAPGYEYTLPTEAQWEFACRAGRVKALYTGDLTIAGERNGPELDAMAWYGGNSGVDYEEGYDSSSWVEKQFEHNRAGTHEVGLKQPNAWGFHDMIGNVYEWCYDWYGSYEKGTATDPEGPSNGSKRVIRGGGWFSKADKCRSANRNDRIPVFGNSSVGFRLALRRMGSEVEASPPSFQ